MQRHNSKGCRRYRLYLKRSAWVSLLTIVICDKLCFVFFLLQCSWGKRGFVGNTTHPLTALESPRTMHQVTPNTHLKEKGKHKSSTRVRAGLRRVNVVRKTIAVIISIVLQNTRPRRATHIQYKIMNHQNFW